MRVLPFLFALGVAASLAAPTLAQTQSSSPETAAQPPPIVVPQASNAKTLSKSQRAVIASELKTRWQAAANARPGGGVRWAKLLTNAVSTTDAEYVLNATTATTLEDLHKALAGGDISKKASANTADTGGMGNGVSSQATLGTTYYSDLVYTPLPNGRCRIYDTRAIGVPLTGTRNLFIDNMPDYTSQGGSGTFANGNSSSACGIPTYAGAWALSVILNSPTANGPVKVFPYGKPQQAGNTIVMNRGTYGSGGDLTVASCYGCAYEIGISSSTAVHVTIDVIGYYRYAQLPTYTPPTPYCYYTPDVSTPIAANGFGEVTAQECASGYIRTQTACWMQHYQANLSGSLENRCWGSAVNFATSVNVRTTCCKIAGKP